MANGVTPWKEAGAVIQVDTAGGAWQYLSDLISGNPGTLTRGAFVTTGHSWKTVQLIKGGVQSGTDKGTPTTAVGISPTLFGGTADLWGNTLSATDVEAVGFGVAVEVGRNDTGATVSDRIQASNFGFDLPTGAVVTGVSVRITWGIYSAGGGTTGFTITVLEASVNYTFNPRAVTSGDGLAAAYVRGIEPTEQDKKFRALVYDSSRNYIGDLTPYIINEPSYKQAINTLHSNMNLNLAQNEQSTATALEEWVNETPENIITDGSENILFDLAAAIGLGPGTNVEVNNEVDFLAYYGAMHEWVTESGEPIITDDGELIMFEDGYPLGKSIFTGYMSLWELVFGDNENVSINLLSHSKELDNIMLETDDVLVMAHGTVSTTSIGISGNGPNDYTRLAQVFRYTGATGSQGHIRLKGWPGRASDIAVSISVYTGTDPATPGTLVGTSSSAITVDGFVDFTFDPGTFTNNSDYIIYVDNNSEPKTGGNPTYPANFYTTTTGIANGALHVLNKNGTWFDSTLDLWFELYTLGGVTTRTFNSQDPGYILRQIADFAKVRGARVAWDASSIELTGTVVSITFKTNTISEAIAAVLKTAPADWYYYYDYGENKLHFHPRPTKPAHYYTKGRDVVKLKVRRSIENLKNDGIFSGGGNPALMIRKTDQSRINDWRRGLFKDSDNRVTVQATAELLTQSVIDQYGEPIYSGELMVARVEDFRIEDVTPGELSAFISFGSLIDPLALQNMSLTYHPDHLDITLDMLTPAVQKRIEDIKRNLALLEHANDPTSPTIT